MKFRLTASLLTDAQERKLGLAFRLIREIGLMARLSLRKFCGNIWISGNSKRCLKIPRYIFLVRTGLMIHLREDLLRRMPQDYPQLNKHSTMPIRKFLDHNLRRRSNMRRIAIVFSFRVGIGTQKSHKRCGEPIRQGLKV